MTCHWRPFPAARMSVSSIYGPFAAQTLDAEDIYMGACHGHKEGS